MLENICHIGRVTNTNQKSFILHKYLFNCHSLTKINIFLSFCRWISFYLSVREIPHLHFSAIFVTQAQNIQYFRTCCCCCYYLPGGWKKFLNMSRSQARPTPGCIFLTTLSFSQVTQSTKKALGPFQGPLKAPKKASERPLWAPTLTVALVALSCQGSGNNIRCTADYWTGRQAFNLKAKSQLCY